MSLKERDEMILRDLSKNNDPENSTYEGLQNFKDSLKVYLTDQLNNHIGNTSELDKQKRAYLQNFVAALLLEHNKNYKNTDIFIKGRFKSDESFITKVMHRSAKKEFDKPIDDMFAFKIIINNTRDIPSKASQLYKEREKNQTVSYIF